MSELRECSFYGQGIDDHADDCYLRLFAIQIADSLMLGDVGMYAHVSREAARTAWNTRAERTCHPVEQLPSIESLSTPVRLSCGHVVDGIIDDEVSMLPNFCEVCGAKVVVE